MAMSPEQMRKKNDARAESENHMQHNVVGDKFTDEQKKFMKEHPRDTNWTDKQEDPDSYWRMDK